MNFWDRVVFRCCLGLCEGYFPGFESAESLMALCRQRNLFDPTALNQLSQVLLLLICPPNSQTHEAVLRNYGNQPLDDLELWATILAALRPRFADFHALGTQGQARQAALVQRAYRVMVVPDLSVFLSRLALIEQWIADAFANATFMRVYSGVGSPLPNAPQPLTIQDDVEVAVYSSFLGGSQPWPIPDNWPEERPTWATDLSPEEGHFLDGCLQRLDGAFRRRLLYLSFYGELSLHTIARIAQRTGGLDITVPFVAGELACAWEAVLDTM